MNIAVGELLVDRAPYIVVAAPLGCLLVVPSDVPFVEACERLGRGGRQAGVRW